jgi:hypothetical protein
LSAWEDLKAVCIECTNCKARITIHPDDARIPRECSDCRFSWLSEHSEKFFDALSKMRPEAALTNRRAPQFRILLEFDEPELARAS